MGKRFGRSQSIHITGKDIEFSLIEEQTIDIDSIEEFEFGEMEEQTNYDNRCKINKLIQAVKHLNKEIQSIKERM